MVKKILAPMLMFFVVAVLALLWFFPRTNKPTKELSAAEKTETQVKESTEVEIAQDKHEEGQKLNQNLAEEKPSPGMDSLSQEISRKICEAEQKKLQTIFESEEASITAIKLAELLKKFSTSQCSSFGKVNAENLLLNTKIDENNFKTFFGDYNRLLEGYTNNSYDMLFQAAINKLESASANESRDLQKVLVSSLRTSVVDASSFSDLGPSTFRALMSLRDKGLVSPDKHQEITKLYGEFDALFKQYLQNRKAARAELPKIPPEKLRTASLEEMTELLGFEGVRVEHQSAKEEYETVERFRHKILDVLGPDFVLVPLGNP